MAKFSEILSMLGAQALGNIPVPTGDWTGKTIIITGANTGLGLECAKHLARLKLSNLILACRDLQKGERAKTDILQETGYKAHTKIEVWELDLANYRSVISFGERVRSTLPRLDGFIANAGMEVEEFGTAEGVERTLTVNVISTFLSAMAVLPKLKESSAVYKTPTTLTFLGSVYHIFGPDGQLDVPEEVDVFTALSDPSTADMQWRYALSKLMVHQCFRELSALVSSSTGDDKTKVVVNLVNPGWCGTELGRAKQQPLFERVNFALVGWTAEKGSRTLVNAISAGTESHGRYISECQFKSQSAYMQSERGERIGRKIWKDLISRMETISPEIAKSVS